MKKTCVVAAMMVGLVACGQNEDKPAVSSGSSRVQQAPPGEQKNGLDGFLRGGPRSTRVVKPEDVKK